MGTDVSLVTVQALSSKTSAKGDIVPLRTAADLVIGGKVVIPKGADAVGQISDARAKGALGMSGRLSVRPLYVRVGTTTIRLAGRTGERATIAPEAVVGMVLLTPALSGRSATIAEGTAVPAMVEKQVIVDLAPAPAGMP
jgi:hypothetical protein